MRGLTRQSFLEELCKSFIGPIERVASLLVAFHHQSQLVPFEFREWLVTNPTKFASAPSAAADAPPTQPHSRPNWLIKVALGVLS